MKKLFLIIFVLIGLSGCYSKRPKTFIQTREPSWAVVELREGLTYDEAWATIVDLLVRKFDLEILNKDEGYIRTGWLYSWGGNLSENYRVKVTIKFRRDKRVIGIKSEANYKTTGGWIIGTDEQLLSTIKTDIMGLVGRVTR